MLIYKTYLFTEFFDSLYILNTESNKLNYFSNKNTVNNGKLELNGLI